MRYLALLMLVSGCCESALPSDSGPSGERVDAEIGLEAGSSLTDVTDTALDSVPAADAHSNPFQGADELGCSELPAAWFRELELARPNSNDCTADLDCLLVESHVDCKEYGLGDGVVAGCATAIRHDQEAEWMSNRDALADALCTARTVPICPSFSLCPLELRARCVDSQCRAL